MIQEQILNHYTEVIQNFLKLGDKDRANVYRNIKARLQSFITQKMAPTLTASVELSIIRKYYKELSTDFDIAKKAGREDLCSNYSKEMEILSKLLPVEATEKDIMTVIENMIKDGEVMSFKNMGNVIKLVKFILPTADSALVAKLVKVEIEKQKEN